MRMNMPKEEYRRYRMKTTAEQLQEMIDNNHALLFMKGTPHHPQCGFSARVVQALI